MSTFALFSVTTMPISLNLSDDLKGRGIVQKLFLIIVLIMSWFFNSTVMQYRHRSNSPIFHCVAMHTVFHVTSLGAEIRMQSGSLSLICHTDSKTPTAFIFFQPPSPHVFSASDEVSYTLCNVSTRGDSVVKPCSVCNHTTPPHHHVE